MANTTPEEWLDTLTRRLDQRRRSVALLRSYVNGDAPLPDMTAETRESWQFFQRRARTNWGKLVCDSVVDRVVPNGITVGGDPKAPGAALAQRIYRDNRMSSVIKEWVRDGMIFGQSYLTAWQHGVEEGSDQVAITADSPETMCVITNPLQRWRPQAVLKVWRDEDEQKDYAVVWLPSGWTQFERGTTQVVEQKVVQTTSLINLAEGRWDRSVGTEDAPTSGESDGIPIVIYNNPGGTGEFESHLDLINRINAGILERLVIAAMQAFRQRAIKGGTLPEKDEKGNTIDYGKVFAPAPGCLWNLPENLDIWESAQTNIEQILNASKDDVRQLSAVTRTPFPILMPDSTNQSAEGARATDSGFVFRCRDRVDEAKLGCEAILVKALKLSGHVLGEDDNVEVSFEPVDRVTVSEKYAAALAAHSAGESWKSIQRNVLGYSPDQIAQDALDRAQDALLAASMAPPQQAPPPQQQAPQNAPRQQDAPQPPPMMNGAPPRARPMPPPGQRPAR